MLKKIIQTAAIVICPLSLHAYENDFEMLYPEDTVAYSHVKSIGKFTQLDRDHPLAKLVAHKTLQSLLGKNKSQDSELRKATINFVTKHCSKRISLGLIGIRADNEIEEMAGGEREFMLSVNISPGNFNVVGVADCSATVGELMDYIKLQEKFSKNKALTVTEEEFEGDLLITLEKEGNEVKLYVSLLDEVIIVATQKDVLKDIVGKVKQPNKQKTLAGNAKFLDATEPLRENDMFAYARLDKAYENIIKNEETSILNHIRKNPQMNMLISADAIANDIHLDAFDSIFFSGKITEDGCDMNYGVAVKSKEGVAALFHHDRNIPEIPDYSFTEFKSMQVSSYDIGAAFQSLESIVSKVSPIGFTSITQQFGETYKAFQTNLVENLEPYYVSLSGHLNPDLQSKRASSKVYVLKVKNDALIHELFEQHGEKLPDLEVKEFMEEKVYSIPGEGGVNYYCAVVNNYLVITETHEDAMWRHVLSQIKNPGENMAGNKELEDLWDSMPQGEVSMGYNDLGQLIMDGYFEEQGNKKRAAKTLPDVKDFHYSIVSKFYQGENFWHSELKLRNFSLQNK